MAISRFLSSNYDGLHSVKVCCDSSQDNSAVRIEGGRQGVEVEHTVHMELVGRKVVVDRVDLDRSVLSLRSVYDVFFSVLVNVN